MGQIIVDNGQARVLVVRHGGIPGSTGPQGPPGNLDGTTTLPQDVNGPLIFNVGQTFGQDVRRYGSLGSDAAVNADTVNAALASPDEWDELIIPLEPGDDLPIDEALELGECSGKKIRTLGTNNPTGFPSPGGRIVQMTSGVPIFHLKDTTFARALDINLALAYNVQQSDPGAVGFKFSPLASPPGEIPGSPHDIRLNLSIEKAYDGIGHDDPGGSAIWNLSLEDVRIWHSYHSAIDLPNSAGAPASRWGRVFIANTNGGPVPTGPAVRHTTGGLTIEQLDVEGWNNQIGEFVAGWYYAIHNLHIEWHSFSGANPYMFDVAGVGLRVREALIAGHPDDPEHGSFTGNANIFRVWTGGSVDVDNVTLSFPSTLAGTLLFMDGPGLDNKSRVGANIRNEGAKSIPILDDTFSAWGTQYAIRQSITTPWVVPALGAGWVAVAGFQAPRYRKSGDRVQLEGFAQNTSGGPLSSTLFTLPTGFRPLGAQVGDGYSTVVTTPVIATNGDVNPAGAIADDGFLPVSTSFSIL